MDPTNSPAPSPEPSDGAPLDKISLPKDTQRIIGKLSEKMTWIGADDIVLFEKFADQFPGWDAARSDWAAIDGVLLYFPEGVKVLGGKPVCLVLTSPEGTNSEIELKLRTDITLPKVDPTKKFAPFLLVQMSTRELIPVRAVDARRQKELWETKVTANLR